MENKTKWLLATCIFGAITTTMFIGNLFFSAKFGAMPFGFLSLQLATLLIMMNTED